MFTLRSRNALSIVFCLISLLFIAGTVLNSRFLISTKRSMTSLPPPGKTWKDKETKSDFKGRTNERENIKEILREMMREEMLNPELFRSRTKLQTGSNNDIQEESEGLPPVIDEPSCECELCTLIDVRVAQSVSSSVRLFCWLPSREKFWNTRLKAVNDTWARRCDKVIYFITRPTNKSHDVIGVNIDDHRQTLTDKTVYAHKFIYRHYLEKYDWFLKADDDTYVIIENLKLLLSHFDAGDPGYIGSQFKHFSPQGYMSGGAGYVFNRGGLKRLVERGYNIPARCRLKGGAEDIETGRCAYKAGIRTLNQLDVYQKQTFFPGNVYAHALGPTPSWAVSYMRAKVEPGKNCCSQLLVSFHYTGPKLMHTVEFLLYGVAVHGRRYMAEKAFDLFDGNEAEDMSRNERRRPYPGESLDEYYQTGWREKNTTIYINPSLV